MRPLLLIFLVVNLVLTGCAGPAATSTTYTPPDSAGGRLCTSQCGKAQSFCRETCDLTQRKCTSKVQAQALIDYEKYMSELFIHQQAIELRPRDFERMEPCESAFKSCASDCESHYQGCYENCGGDVDITTSCRFLCF